MYNLNRYINSNYGYMNSPPFHIGIYLPPLLYGLLVIIVFNVVLVGEYILINKVHVYKENDNYNLAF